MQSPSAEELYRRAAARCARQEQCRGDLVRKFCEKGLAHAEAEALADRLEDEGFIDDARYARAFVHDKSLYDHWGRIKIRQALRQKGVGAAETESALATIDEEEYRRSLQKAVQQKARTLPLGDDDYTRRQKLARFAASRGFEPALIFSLLDLEE